MSKVYNPSAFPIEAPFASDRGMTLRDWFAGGVAAGLCSAVDSSGTWTSPIQHGQASIVAERAYAVADAMLAQRSQSVDEPKMQHVAYYDEGQFHWMSGIAPRDCELFAKAAKP